MLTLPEYGNSIFVCKGISNDQLTAKDMNIEKGTEENRIEIYRLILSVAQEHVFPTLEQEGRDYFSKCLMSDIQEVLSSNNKMYLLARENELLGVSGFTLGGHVNHLFVSTSAQGRGVGKLLLEESMIYIESSSLNLNASLNAIGFYEHRGFIKIGPQTQINGVKYQSMECRKG